MLLPEEVVTFWLGAPGAPPRANAKKWFAKDDAFDAEVRARFGEAIAAAKRGALAAWRTTPRGRLALVLLCDQLSRNAFRGAADAFAQDALALEVAEEAIAAGDDAAFSPIEQRFLRMPLMHAEDRQRQARSLAEFARLARSSPPELQASALDAARYAKLHADIIERFGRFPGRNAALGRESTPEEIEFLQQPGSSF